MMKLAALTLVASVAVTSVAHAQAPGETAPLVTPNQPSDAQTSGDEGPKNPNTALMLSLGGTAASLGMMFIGASSNNGDLASAGLISSLVTPSLGEWYAGKPLTAGMGIRVASGVAFIWGVAQAFKCFDDEDGSCSNDNNAAGFAIVGGMIGYATGTIYDIATAPGTAREYNRAHLHMQLQPAVLRTPSGMSTMGVGIGGSF